MVEKPRGLIVNRTGLCHVMGVSLTTVDAWIRAGCPVRKHATGRGGGATGWEFETATVIEWRRLSAIAEAGGGEGGDAALAESERRLAAAKAALAEMALAEKRRLMVNVDDVAGAVAKEYGAVRARVRGIPVKLAPALAKMTEAAAVRAALEKELDDALSELAGAVLVAPDDRTGGDDLPPEEPAAGALEAPPTAS